MEKYIKDGKVAILVSPGFGAGWSTWNNDDVAYDKRVVEFFLEHKDDKEFLKELDDLNSKTNSKVQEIFKEWGYDDIYFGGFNDIEIEWLPVGTQFIIREYDGSETLVPLDQVHWLMA